MGLRLREEDERRTVLSASAEEELRNRLNLDLQEPGRRGGWKARTGWGLLLLIAIVIAVIVVNRSF